MGDSRKWASAARAILVAVILLAAGPARADHAAEMKARESFAAGRYSEALELFAKLYAETLHPVYLRNIGRCHQKMREPEKAIDAFRDYLTKSKKMPTDERQEIEGYIREMEALRNEQARPPTPAPAPPAPVPVAPPPPAPVVLAAPAPAPAPQPSLVASPAPRDSSESAPIYGRWWFWTAIAVVAAGGVAAALLIPGGTNRPTCPPETLGMCK